MKKLLLLTCTVILVFFANAKAQPPSPEEMAKMETESMKTELNLNADQLTKVEAINLKYAQKMGEMFQQGPPADFTEAQKKMGEIQKQKRTEFEKVLTADQLKKYDQMQEERMKNAPGGPDGPPM
jgi:Spy/CpxP family protein refolding chaperone